jgi:putative transposase
MALHWCAASTIKAGKQFRRVNGHLHLPALPHDPHCWIRLR